MHDQLPTGTVTFLFTDIEGSTRLLDEVGPERYAQLLAEHRALLREAFATHGGAEVDTQGDAFFVAFPTAPGAAAAASDAQRSLTAGPLRVRMGLHTGTPLLDTEGYVGPDVHRAARIAAAGHGGQVLVSAATAALVPSIELHDLGVHRLKDLSAAERIYQLGGGEFPPLRTLYQTNLPIPPTPFLGRKHELAAVTSLAGLADVRLLTLTGPGGTGKTRLAIQSAAELGDSYQGGVWWIPLDSLRDPQLVLASASRAVGARNGLAEHIGDSSMLLVFDNFEQVVDAGTDVAQVLRACPNLRVLVTSREALHVSGEQEYPVPPLSMSDAVDLFMARATAADPAFTDDGTVAEICRRLEELPLAIELAAARVKVLSPPDILQRLERRLSLLTGGARDVPQRQRTLRAAIEWSHELLPDHEQRFFARLSVFRGGCTLEAAEAVTDAGLDELQALVDKSLLRYRDNRFRMLETIREFAVERLDASGEADAMAHRHVEFFSGLAAEAESHLQRDDIEWVERLERDHDNLRAVLDYFEERGDWQALLELCGSLYRFWYLHSHLREGQRRLEIALATDAHPTHSRSKALRAASVMLLNIGDPAEARRYAQESLELSRKLDDRWGEAYALMMIGNAAADAHELSDALPYMEESARLFDALGDEHYVLIALYNLSWVAGALGDPARDRQLIAEVLDSARAAGNQRMVAGALASLGDFAREDGELDAARQHYAEAIAIEYRRGDRQDIAINFGRMAAVAVRTGQPGIAGRLLGYSDACFERLGATRSWWDRDRNAETTELLSAALGPEGLSAPMEAGRAMTEEEIVELATQPRSASGT